ncbi:hypothetical protein ACS0TY_009570 [Phlomoides rotata]
MEISRTLKWFKAFCIYSLLRIMDTNRRSYIGYVYDGISGKKVIKDVFRHTKRLYKPFTDIIKARWDKKLRRDIHAASYLLNSTFAYDRENMCKMKEIIDIFIDMVTTLIGDKSIQRKCIDEEALVDHLLWIHQRQCNPMNGGNSFNVILSQTSSSSSGCERNWSVFEKIHTKKRNKLEHPRLNDLVFVHYNLCLQERLKRKRICYDHIDHEGINKTNFRVVEEEEEEENHPHIIDVDELNNMFYDEDDIHIQNKSK